MATLLKGKTFTATEQVTAAKLHALIDDGTVSGIINADCASGMALADTKLAQITTANKVASTAITDGALDVAAITCDSVASAGALTATTIGGSVGTLTGGLVMTQGTAPTTGATQGGLFTKDSGGEAELFYVRESDGTEVQITSDGVLNSGAITQVVNVQDGTFATGTTVMPGDNSIPQISEGDEYMTLAITPTTAATELKIEVVVNASNSGEITVVGLFQDATAGALAAVSKQQTVNWESPISFTHYMTSGTTSSTTFRVRIGADTAGTISFNGSSGAQLLGGVMASSITITEIVP